MNKREFRSRLPRKWCLQTAGVSNRWVIYSVIVFFFKSTDSFTIVIFRCYNQFISRRIDFLLTFLKFFLQSSDFEQFIFIRCENRFERMIRIKVIARHPLWDQSLSCIFQNFIWIFRWTWCGRAPRCSADWIIAFKFDIW